MKRLMAPTAKNAKHWNEIAKSNRVEDVGHFILGQQAEIQRLEAAAFTAKELRFIISMIWSYTADSAEEMELRKAVNAKAEGALKCIQQN